MRGAVCTTLLVWALAQAAAPGNAAVRVWQGTLTIPTYEEGPPNPNPPFDLFSWGRFNYPYTLRDALTDRRQDVVWRSLHLENEYLRLTVLPDLGGRIYSCLDKRTSREMFYANPSIKKALIGYRGAWAAFGVEFNFPVSHNWVSMSPVDFATQAHPDGSGSIWVGNTDQVYGGTLARGTAPGARDHRARAARRVVQRRRRATSLLLVEQRRRAGVGRLAARLSHRGDEHARLHEARAVAHRCRCPRPERDSPANRRSRVALHLRDARGICRRVSPAHAKRHGASGLACRAAGAQGLVLGRRPRGDGLARCACRTTTARTSSCRQGCSGTRRPTPSWSRTRPCGSPNTGCLSPTWAGSPGPPRAPC